MDLSPSIPNLQQICRENGISLLAVFGSVARNEDSPTSDVDLLIRLREPIGLIRYIQLEEKFVKALGRRVDLATEESLHPRIRNNVMRDLTIIYEDEKG